MTDTVSSRLSENSNEVNTDKIEKIKGIENMNFEDDEDYVDDIKDDELLSEFMFEEPTEQIGTETIMVIDNVPQVNEDRLEKLKKVIMKNVSTYGEIVQIYYPKEKEGKTKGYIFIEYATPTMAKKAILGEDGRKLDKSHIFKTYFYSDFIKYSNIPDEWEEPKPAAYADNGDLRSWLLNQHCHDEYAIVMGEGKESVTTVYSGAVDYKTRESREVWTNSYIRWSPQGTYFLTFHEQGVVLWGGESYTRLSRLSHHNVDLIDFSPCERYLVTMSIQNCKDNNSGQDALIIWDIRTGTVKRTFNAIPEMTMWPIFKWNFDGTYFARLNKDSLSIYQTSDFTLLDLKSIRIKLIKDFSWSPTDNLISYWVEEESNGAARISLIEIPSRKLVAMKNLFKVRDCKMHWQKSGDFLCVKVDRYSKLIKEKDMPEKDNKYTGMSYVFNVFRIRDKEIPIDDIQVKETIMAFAWEPIGTKFAYVHGENQRICVSFCDVKDGKIDVIKTFEKRQCNSIFWSPRGQFCVLAGLRGMHGNIEFIDTNDMTVMLVGEHFNASDLEWDPTGRYVSTSINSYVNRADNGHWIWSFQGKILRKEACNVQRQFLWRPRPKCLLTNKNFKELRKNMKRYNQTFALDDKMKESKATKEQIDKRRDQLDKFNAWKESLANRYESESMARYDLRGGLDIPEDEDEIEDVEFLINTEEIIL